MQGGLPLASLVAITEKQDSIFRSAHALFKTISVNLINPVELYLSLALPDNASSLEIRG